MEVGETGIEQNKKCGSSTAVTKTTIKQGPKSAATAYHQPQPYPMPHS
jgi:hypothetical protein